MEEFDDLANWAFVGVANYNAAMDWIYLDSNATTQPAPEVVAVMQEVNEQLWANPSSVHRFGQMARQRVELARASVAKLIGARDRELIFTSGGTESNNLALRGVFAAKPDNEGGRCVLITNRVEHSAIREPAAFFAEHGVEVVYIDVDINGCVQPESLDVVLGQIVKTGDTILVSVQWANNETGTIQPLDAIANVIERHRQRLREIDIEQGGRSRLLFHSDATQAVGKIPVDVQTIPIDLMTFAAHKFHGPKGIGGLYVRSGVKLQPINLGGPQERDRRGGTENTPGIIGMGVAAELADAFLGDGAADREVEQGRALRDRFETKLCESLPGAVVNSVDSTRIWNTSNVAFPQLEAEAILLSLSERSICASAGAACSSGSLEPSPVLLAMGIPETLAHGSVRFSLSRYTTEKEIDAALRVVPQVIEKLSRTLPVG